MYLQLFSEVYNNTVAYATNLGVMMNFLMKYVKTISRCFTLYREEELKINELSGYQHPYLRRICENPGISQDQLAKMLHVNKSNVARQLALLEQNGYIVRKESSKDKRQFEVYPLEKGIEIYPRIIEVIEAWNEELLAGFSDEEKQQLFIMLDRLMDKALTLTDSQESEDEICEKSGII